MKKNGFLTFCFSFIPGAGQMYQGYMKKGMSLMTLLAIFIAIASLTNINIFVIPIPLILAYSFFDTYNLRGKIGTDKQEEDKAIWDNQEVKDTLCGLKINKKNKFIGICLIFIGVYVLLNSVLMNMAIQYDWELAEEITRIIRKYLAPIIVATISIVLGVKFISKNNE